MSYTYLLLNLSVVSIPLLAPLFWRRVNYYAWFGVLLPALLIAAVPFLLWDVWFTEVGYWGFDARYLIGLSFLGLPIEEWLFFLCIPLASLYFYASAKTWFRRSLSVRTSRLLLLGLVGGVLSLLGLAQLIGGVPIYTTIVLLHLAVVLLTALFVSPERWLQPFGVMLLCVAPFFLLTNGILTAGLGGQPVVWYADEAILGLRIGSIPAEDAIYAVALLLSDVVVWEWLVGRFGLQKGDTLPPKGVHLGK